MPPKGSKGGGGGASRAKSKEEERERTLQAVVLADSFEKRFAPFTLERPRCLLPLANVPLIEYTLEFLANAGVEEVFVYCGAHTDQLEQYLAASKWKRPTSPFTEFNILRSVATSVGDAMRDLDGRGLITGDFLMVAGDVVSNISLQPALAQHRARRDKDKNAAMTMVLREAGPEHRSKPRGNRPIFVLAPETDRCIWYDEMWRLKGSAHNLELDPEYLATYPEIEIRSDLIDCGIDICTPDVLSLWSENFDFNSVRRGFLRGVLKDYELNGKTFHTYIDTTGYAARVRDFRAYDAISRDMVGRWTYPLTPDCNIFAGQTYQLDKNKVYIEDGVSLARGSTVQRRSVVGRGTSVGINSTITDSIVGRGCHIGNNVAVRGAYIWPHCSIGDNSVVDGAVIADEAHVGRGCVVSPGCLLSYKVRIADGVTVMERSRITRAATATPPAPSSRETPLLVGSGGDGHAYHTPSSSAASSPAASPLLRPVADSASAAATKRRDSFISTLSISTVHSYDSPSSSRRPSTASHDAQRPEGAHFRAGSSGAGPGFVPEAGVSEKSAAAKAKLQRDFVGEATASVYDGLVASEPGDKIRLELVAQRLAADASDAAVRDALVAAFLQRTFALLDAPQNPRTPATAVQSVWGAAGTGYGWLLAHMGIFGRPDQRAVLRAVEAAAAARPDRPRAKQVLLFIIREGVDGDWLHLDAIEEWWAADGQPPGAGALDKPPVRELVKTYLEILRESSEEESSDEEEDESGEDEDSE